MSAVRELLEKLRSSTGPSRSLDEVCDLLEKAIEEDSDEPDEVPTTESRLAAMEAILGRHDLTLSDAVQGLSLLQGQIAACLDAEEDLKQGVFHGHRHLDPEKVERQLRILESRLDEATGAEAVRRMIRQNDDRMRLAEERIREALGEAWDNPEMSADARIGELSETVADVERRLQERIAQLRSACQTHVHSYDIPSARVTSGTTPSFTLRTGEPLEGDG